MRIMTVFELIERLRQLPPGLDVHVLADPDRNLVDIASVHLIALDLTEHAEPFVVIDLLHEDGAAEIQDDLFTPSFMIH
jgi:hypothetical protein